MVNRLENQDDAGFIKPRLRVFLSVDLIGSTEYKILHRSDEATATSWWPIVSMLFYTDFQRKLLENWDGYASVASANDVGDKPKLWKAQSDELIFSKICTSQDQVVAAVQVWRRTLLDFKINWSHPELRFKTGGWLVGTPCRNWEVAFLRAEPDQVDLTLSGDPIAYNFNLLRQYYDQECPRKIDIDFIGPSMDCGFRILAFSDERKFVMSADLAFLLSFRVGPWREKAYRPDYPALQFYYLGAEVLKGFSRVGITYPIFWLDAFDMVTAGDSTIHATMMDKLSELHAIEPSRVGEALEPFLKGFGGPPDWPYICSVRDDGEIVSALSDAPGEHVREINRLRKHYLDAVSQEQSIKKSLEASDGQGEEEPTPEMLDEEIENLRQRQKEVAPDK